jgi:beta-glucanase (GH16 family)
MKLSSAPVRIRFGLASVVFGLCAMSCVGVIGPAASEDAGSPANPGLGGARARDAAESAGVGGAPVRDAAVDLGTGGAPVHDAAVDLGAGGAPVHDAGTDTGTISAYTLVFSDEFEGTSLDRTKWCTRYVYGGGAPLQVPDTGCTGPDGFGGTLDFLNDEQQRYVDTNSQGQALHVESAGTLKMVATKTRTDTYASYESAMIRSKMQFKPSATTSYYILARVRLPNVKGTWPAMWLSCGYGSTSQIMWPPEIDIFEGALNMVEDNPNMIRMGSQVKGGMQTSTGMMDITFSSPTYDRTWDNYFAPAPDTLRGVWVNIGATWTASAVCYYVNGLQTMCENYRWTDDSGNPANTGSLLLNLAIGGAWAGRHGIDDASFPATYEVDYVHVYSFAGLTPPGTLPQ